MEDGWMEGRSLEKSPGRRPILIWSTQQKDQATKKTGKGLCGGKNPLVAKFRPLAGERSPRNQSRFFLLH
jgi:hypothetical protein